MEKIAIIGAGLVGSLQAIIFAKKGYEVDVYERRPDMRKIQMSAGKSINLALSNRGWKALKIAGVDDKVMKMAIPMYGRMMHDNSGNTSFQAYGIENQAIYSVSRGGLNQVLMNEAEKHPNVRLHFSHQCEDIDLMTNQLQLLNTETKEEIQVNPSRIFATDGAFSAIRARLQRTDRFNYEQMYLPHGYKELFIPAGPENSFLIDKNSLHIWPRGEYMLIALANDDGSFTCTLFFPFEGKNSFASIQTEDELNTFFKAVFPDAMEIMPNLVQDFFGNPTSSLVTVRCAPWNYEDRIMLLGDAAHAIVPFYGQGMNSGFEDCSIFHEVFEENNRDWKKSFEQFASSRKKDADAISNLAIQNFTEMRDLVADEKFLLRKKIEKKLFIKHPDKWMPLYSQVTFSHIPYSEALAAGKRQEKIMDQIMAIPNIENRWDDDDIESQIWSLNEHA